LNRPVHASVAQCIRGIRILPNALLFYSSYPTLGSAAVWRMLADFMTACRPMIRYAKICGGFRRQPSVTVEAHSSGIRRLTFTARITATARRAAYSSV